MSALVSHYCLSPACTTFIQFWFDFHVLASPEWLHSSPLVLWKSFETLMTASRNWWVKLTKQACSLSFCKADIFPDAKNVLELVSWCVHVSYITIIIINFIDDNTSLSLWVRVIVFCAFWAIPSYFKFNLGYSSWKYVFCLMTVLNQTKPPPSAGFVFLLGLFCLWWNQKRISWLLSILWFLHHSAGWWWACGFPGLVLMINLWVP